MFGMGVPELILILAIALVVIGPKKLPGLAKSMGRAMREFKKATSELKQSMEIDELDNVKKAFDDMNTDVKDVLKSSLDPGSDSIADAAPKPGPVEGESDKSDAGDAATGESDSSEPAPPESEKSESEEFEASEAPGKTNTEPEEGDSGELAPSESEKSESGESEASEAPGKTNTEPGKGDSESEASEAPGKTTAEPEEGDPGEPPPESEKSEGGESEASEAPGKTTAEPEEAEGERKDG